MTTPDSGRILGFGENSIDIVFRVSEYPQPAGTAKVEIQHRDVRCGGQVATTLATCAALGLETRYIGTFGSDDYGRLIRDELARRGVDVSHAVVRDAPNRYAVIVIDPRGERVVLWQRDARLTLRAADVQREWLDGISLVHVDATDVDGGLRLARMAREAGLPVTCDIDGITPATRGLLDVVTIPIVAAHVPRDLTGIDDVEAALRAMRQPHHRHVVVTRGEHGAAVLTGDQFVQMPGFSVAVTDTTGAGDVFRGAFICAWLRGAEPAEVLRFANAAAAVSCTRAGALESTPTLEETYDVLSSARDATS